MQKITNPNLLIFVLILQLLLITTAFSAVEDNADFKAPDWFKQSFLDLQEDLDDANESGKNIMLYFHQDGCPYCKKLLQDNFSRTDIVNRMKQNYEVLEINMWGDKTITDVGGDEYSEKEFAKKMQVMFTPTLLILDKNGLSKFRINGYYSPDKFMAVLDYLELKKVNKTEQTVTFTEYFRKKSLAKTTARAELQTEKYIIQTDNLQKLIRDSQKPVMVLFEQNYCQDCDEVHGDLFRRLPIYKRLQRFTIAQIDINSSDIITSPDGKKMTQKDFAQQENIQYTPSIYFYESAHTKNPIFRSEAYLRGFHLETVLDYVSSNAYKTEAEFQRFVQRRADEMAEKGIKVDLWK
ncbi:MAG: thioredoxin fold domain-containing protein [Proteobacteria bacterium]|nr:thioredoxin fold domain-containing protein [Pseudomonadota bacterium]